jgi:type II secretory pathway predicted ATPase ExeA/cell division protein FtsN
MFLPYFNFKENPFNLNIGLDYFYLGRHHEEANAHLTYAVSEGEGFIVITGERGVGKTTVCRSFLEGLDPNVETAYIDRSTSNARKLLLYITSEFKIRSDQERIKDLADALNEFLMQKKLEGKKVAVFIDDAHNLSSDVLEQVRLISNLETSKDKLLQLILIGEPKLSEMLNSNELRQIGQRVSVGYRIGPLTYDETLGYIHHRLTIASIGPPIRFEPKAVRLIFKYSRGIPRNINIVCNQALEIAYKQKLKDIDTVIAKEAIHNLNDRTEAEEPKSRNRWVLGSVAAVFCLIFAIAITAYFFSDNRAQISTKKLISEKIPVAPGQTTEMPGSSRLSSSVTPKPPAMKEDMQAEPIQIDEPVLPANASDPSAVNREPLVLKEDIPGEPVQADEPVRPADTAGPSTVSPEPRVTKEEMSTEPVQTDESVMPVDTADPSYDRSDPEQRSTSKMTHSVQVGAFRKLENAVDLIDRLVTKGYSARIVEVADQQGKFWFTVRIGDHPSLKSAAEQARIFMENENMKTFIRPYKAE